MPDSSDGGADATDDVPVDVKNNLMESGTALTPDQAFALSRSALLARK